MNSLESIKILAEEVTVHGQDKDLHILEKISNDIDLAEIVDDYELFNDVMDLLIYSIRENYYSSKDTPISFIDFLKNNIQNEELDKQIKEDFEELIEELSFQ